MAQQEVETRPYPAMPATSPSAPVSWFSPWWTLAVLSLLNIIATVDRGGLTLLVNPIKADFGLSDVEMSLLMGLAYTLVSSTLLIPAGYATDMFSRRGLIGWSVAAWSCMSALTGFANGFWMLIFTRSGLAGAEAALPPAAHSMIRDAFPPEKRGIPFSIYTCWAHLGTSISLLVSGTLIVMGDTGFFSGWPVIGHFKTWQIVLAFPGFCTLPLSLLMLTVREPERRASQAIRDSVATFRDALRYVGEHRWVYGPFFAAITVHAVANGGQTWRATALIRGWGLHAAQIAHITGTVGLISGIAGLLATGWLMDRLSKRGIADGPIRVALIGNGIAAVCTVAVYHVHAPWMIYTLMGMEQFFGPASASSAAITLAYITPSRLMGRMVALMFLCISLPGSPGPTFVALIAKYFYADQGDLGIISAINVYASTGQVAYLGLLLLLAVRVGRFHKTYQGGAG
jgi:MFS family permease